MPSRYDRWEYHIELSDPHPEAARLNALGTEGWDLVAALPNGRLIFKRPAPSLRERITLDQRAAVDATQQSGDAQ